MNWIVDEITQTFHATFSVTKRYPNRSDYAISVEDFYASCRDGYVCMPNFNRYVFKYRNCEETVRMQKFRQYVIGNGLIIAAATNHVRAIRKLLISGASAVNSAFDVACINGSYDAVFTLVCGDFPQTRSYDFSRICPSEICPLMRDFVRSCCVFNALGKRYPWIDLHAFDAIDSGRDYNFTTIDIVTRNACIMRAIRNDNIARIAELEASGPYNNSLAFAESCRMGNVELIERYMDISLNYVEFGALIACRHHMYDALEILLENFWDFDADTCMYYASRDKIDCKLLNILKRYRNSNLHVPSCDVRVVKLNSSSEIKIFERETQDLLLSELLNELDV